MISWETFDWLVAVARTRWCDGCSYQRRIGPSLDEEEESSLQSYVVVGWLGVELAGGRWVGERGGKRTRKGACVCRGKQGKDGKTRLKQLVRLPFPVPHDLCFAIYNPCLFTPPDTTNQTCYQPPPATPSSLDDVPRVLRRRLVRLYWFLEK